MILDYELNRATNYGFPTSTLRSGRRGQKSNQFIIVRRRPGRRPRVPFRGRVRRCPFGTTTQEDLDESLSSSDTNRFIPVSTAVTHPLRNQSVALLCFSGGDDPPTFSITLSSLSKYRYCFNLQIGKAGGQQNSMGLNGDASLLGA